MNMIVPKSSYQTVTCNSAKLRIPIRDHWNVSGVVSLGRFLILKHEIRAEIECNRLELCVLRVKYQSLKFNTSSRREGSPSYM